MSPVGVVGVEMSPSKMPHKMPESSRRTASLDGVPSPACVGEFDGDFDIRCVSFCLWRKDEKKKRNCELRAEVCVVPVLGPDYAEGCSWKSNKRTNARTSRGIAWMMHER